MVRNIRKNETTGLVINNVHVMSLTTGDQEWDFLTVELTQKMELLFRLRLIAYPEIWSEASRSSDSGAIGALIDKEIERLQKVIETDEKTHFLEAMKDMDSKGV